MSTQQFRTRPDAEPHPTTRTRPTTEPISARAAVAGSPQTFSSRNTAQLQNLIDEFNAAFAASGD
ncbi:hypothetical protein [Natronolimnohabitans innermongolicus]|uniref:Uncharacterized protein n=1 Tax=Natronolimnohabitans innermongolicus JCM 12255 TaxID=1227499 RepID=L9WVT7_9EURY|nr:hypothetical protein [Natronolimnohabitans innermongolicus]ELY53311.1 hypothetical protein C493_14813 [Natronolimnohabitans innermongolicus JCM 12255]